ncbi:hypothetical protein ACFX13_010352 [Malus domestica]
MLSFGRKVWPMRTQNGVVSGSDDPPHGHGGRAPSHVLDLSPARVPCRGGAAQISSLEDDEAAVAPGHMGHVRACILAITSCVGDGGAN